MWVPLLAKACALGSVFLTPSCPFPWPFPFPSFRAVNCLPLHLRVLQVHYIQHAYVAVRRINQEAGAKVRPGSRDSGA
jgi:hypothetical protein